MDNDCTIAPSPTFHCWRLMQAQGCVQKVNEVSHNRQTGGVTRGDNAATLPAIGCLSEVRFRSDPASATGSQKEQVPFRAGVGSRSDRRGTYLCVFNSSTTYVFHWHGPFLYNSSTLRRQSEIIGSFVSYCYHIYYNSIFILCVNHFILFSPKPQIIEGTTCRNYPKKKLQLKENEVISFSFNTFVVTALCEAV